MWLRQPISPDTRTVARWEFFNTLRTPTFLLLTFAVPLVMMLIAGLSFMTAQTAEEESAHVAVMDCTGHLHDILQEQAENLPVHVSLVHEDVDQLKMQVLEGEYAGLLYLELEDVQDGQFTYWVNNPGQAQVPEVQHMVETATSIYRLRRLGLTEDQISRAVSSVHLQVASVGDEEDILGAVMVPFVMAMTLIFSSLFSGQMLMYGIIKEKRNRIAEILLSCVTASDLLWGKLLGYGGLGLLQVIIWAGVGAAVTSRFYYLGDVFPDLPDMLLYLAYFLGGYFLLATVHAAMGSSMKEVEGGSQAQGLIVIIPLMPVFLGGQLMMNPNALWVRILCHLPPFIPTASLIRLAAGDIPAWEVATSLSVLILSVWFFMHISSRLFASGMLRFSGIGSLSEFFQLLRNG